MAIFEKEETETKSYIGLMDKSGENLVAFISPVKGVSAELLIETMRAKDLNVELRESKPPITELEL